MVTTDDSTTTRLPYVLRLLSRPIFFIPLMGMVFLALFVSSMVAVAWLLGLLGLPVSTDTRFLLATVMLSTTIIMVGLLLQSAAFSDRVDELVHGIVGTENDDDGDDGELAQLALIALRRSIASGVRQHDVSSGERDQFDRTPSTSAPPPRNSTKSGQRRKVQTALRDALMDGTSRE
jgi:uncharacterized membrane protein (DUF485 family)